MSNQQPEADHFLQEHGIVAGPEDGRTTLEVAIAWGYLATTSAGVEVTAEHDEVDV